MNEHIDAVRGQVDAGSVSAETLVLLFRAAEDAEERRDVEGLEEALELARRIAGGADAALGVEAERLVALCEERLERTGAGRDAVGSGSSSDATACPGCGRPVDASAVRCRACGTLLV